jgi:hypothetical protein
MGNPFADESGDTRDVADPAIVATVRGIEKVGQDQNDNYRTERILQRTTPISLRVIVHCFQTCDGDLGELLQA